MPTVPCVGYCGGRTRLDESRMSDDGRMCPDCYETWRENAERQIYWNRDE